MDEQNIFIEDDITEVIDASEETLDVATEETIETIEVVDIQMVEVGVDSAFPALGSTNDMSVHNNLDGLDAPNAHPISAIKNLREELNRLDTVKTPQTLYADKVNTANYFKWADNAAYDESGYFVSLTSDSSTVKICDGISRIFGVSVPEAGFIGNQDADVPRDAHYGLIVTSGVVEVRCEYGVEVGDYVVSSARGCAIKSNSNYGYEVIGIVDKTDDTYAVISLGVQADVANALGEDLAYAQSKIDVNEKNIVSAINVANQAYQKSTEAATVSEEAVKQALEAVLKSDQAKSDVEGLGQSLESVSASAEQAKALADSAVVSAASMKTEAVNRANDAWAKADKVETEAYSLCAKIDKYSVGKYSQAYGLTYEQAQSILEPGIIYVPITNHTEEYSEYKRNFLWGYYYTWSGSVWMGSETSLVAFSDVYITGNEQNLYWYIPNANDVMNEGVTYAAQTLYSWEEDHWVAVATLKGNVSNRMVSEVYQTTNEIALDVFNAHKSIAGLDIRLTNTEAEVLSTTQWAKGMGADGYNITAIEQESTEEKSTLALTVADVNGNKVLNGASIVLSQEDNESFISLDADRIDFKGGEIKFDATNINFDAENYSIHASKIVLDGEVVLTIPENGETKINGANIATGTLSADKITTGTLDAKLIGADELSAISANLGTVEAGVLQSKDYRQPKIWKNTSSVGLVYQLSADQQYWIVAGLGTCTDTTVIIPSVYDDGEHGLPVSAIKSSAFINCKDLISVTIPESVTSIGSGAFRYCSGLTHITIPNNVTNIETWTFEGCKSLKNVVIGNGVTSIGIRAFEGCTSLTNITIPNSVQTISGYAFVGCTNLTDVTIGEGVNTIGNYAFGDWASGNCYLKSVFYTKTKSDWDLINVDVLTNEWTIYVPRYYYSETFPGDDGLYWYYDEENGFKISCDGDNVIESKYFKVSQDGTVSAQKGAIGDFLEIGNGYLMFKNVNSIVQKDGYDEIAGMTYSGNSPGAFFAGKEIAKDGDGEYIINTDGSYQYTGKWAFNVTHNGIMEAKRGKIGNLTISNNGLIYGTENDMSSPWISVTSDGVKAFTIYGNNGTIGNWNFSGTQGLAGYWNSDQNATNLKPEYAAYRTGTNGMWTQCKWSTMIDTINHATTGSDFRIKKDIENYDDRYEELFDNLKPCRYKYIDGTSDRFHTGFIAQEVVDAIEKAQLTTWDFAAVTLRSPNTDEECWHLRRDEFVALNTWQIQKLKARVTALEKILIEEKKNNEQTDIDNG